MGNWNYVLRMTDTSPVCRVSTGRLKPLKTFKKLKLEARLLSCCLLVSTFVMFLTLRRSLQQDPGQGHNKAAHTGHCQPVWPHTPLQKKKQHGHHFAIKPDRQSNNSAFASVFICPINCYILCHVVMYMVIRMNIMIHFFESFTSEELQRLKLQ